MPVSAMLLDRDKKKIPPPMAWRALQTAVPSPKMSGEGGRVFWMDARFQASARETALVGNPLHCHPQLVAVQGRGLAVYTPSARAWHGQKEHSRPVRPLKLGRRGPTHCALNSCCPPGQYGASPAGCRDRDNPPAAGGIRPMMELFPRLGHFLHRGALPPRMADIFAQKRRPSENGLAKRFHQFCVHRQYPLDSQSADFL